MALIWIAAISLKLNKQFWVNFHRLWFACKSTTSLPAGCQHPFFIKLCTRCRYLNESGAFSSRPLCRRELHHQQAATMLGATSRPCCWRAVRCSAVHRRNLRHRVGALDCESSGSVGSIIFSPQ